MVLGLSSFSQVRVPRAELVVRSTTRDLRLVRLLLHFAQEMRFAGTVPCELGNGVVPCLPVAPDGRGHLRGGSVEP